MDFDELEKELGLNKDKPEEEKENKEKENKEKENKEKENKELEDLLNILDGEEDGIIKLDEEESMLEEEPIVEEESVAEEEPTQETQSKGKKEKKEKSKKEKPTFNLLGASTTKNEFKSSTIAIYTAVLFLFILIILTIIFFSISLNKIKVNNLEKQIKRESEKVRATLTPTEENSAYLGIAKEIDRKPLILEKVSIDPVYFKFYIKSFINPINYKISLTDNAETLYPMEINFTNINGENMEIRFNREGALVSDYELKFESLETGEENIFSFRIPNINIDKKVKYINDITKVQGDGFEIKLTGGKFSSTGSSIYYTIETYENSAFDLQQGVLGKDSQAKLSGLDKVIEPLGNKTLNQQIGQELILGRADFQPVSDLNQNLVVTFNNLYKSYNVNKTFTLDQLNSGDNVIEFDKYKLVLEGMPKFDEKFVLVAHMIDTTLSTENRKEDFNRVEIVLDADLYAKTSEGIEISLSPTSFKTAPYGTDVVFDTSESDNQIFTSLASSNLKLKVNSVNIKMQEISIPLKLDTAMDRELIIDQSMMEQLKRAFISRLDYKYKGKAKNNIIGFAPEVLENNVLLTEYQQENGIKNPQYSIDLISKKLEQDTLYAIIQETVKYNSDNNQIIVYRTHKIKATYSEGIWTIISDEVIK